MLEVKGVPLPHCQGTVLVILNAGLITRGVGRQRRDD
jgi:hypothetical protein